MTELVSKRVLIVGSVVLLYGSVLYIIYQNFPELEESERPHLKFPRNLEDAKALGKVLSKYKDQHFYTVFSGIAAVYIVLQSFAIPGSIFLTILSGYLFPFFMALGLVCTCSACGAAVCYCLSYLVGRKLVASYFPERVSGWQQEIQKHRENLFNYIVVLRITPVLPNWFINIASPVIDVSIVPFFWGTFVGVAPPSMLFIQAGTTLQEMVNANIMWSWRNVIMIIVSTIVFLLPEIPWMFFKVIFLIALDLRMWNSLVNLGEIDKLEYELAVREHEKLRLRNLREMNMDPMFDYQGAPRRRLPHVYDMFLSSTMSEIPFRGTKLCLPQGSTFKNNKQWEEIYVPPTKKECDVEVKKVKIETLDPLGKMGFEGVKELNTIQSIVFEQAYHTVENLLICAPTGAGKTNIAMLAVLKTIRDHCKPNGTIDKKDFKIIYIAPMKALAAEMTANFSKRLSKLGLNVRELTGDTTLTKKEISETQMLVLTPEKWDVVTRKANDEELTSFVRLLIIDEVHLLHDERGPVIETIVARTLRRIQMSQHKVRIIGLSATLPNYIDVANFLQVDPEKGLFFFDGRFRPVPLSQTFIGVGDPLDKSISAQSKMYDEVCYRKCLDFVKEGHQVLVFVHTRNGTMKIAQALMEMAGYERNLEYFLPDNTTKREYLLAKKQMQNAKNKEIEKLFLNGFGIHHAGMIRQHRTMMERMFSEGHIRVLACTATLAWGVNLPAAAVIIRGTEIFDQQKGVFNDIGVLDVQQIFGRAGRPQYESVGHGVIITAKTKVLKYVMMLIRQAPIESQFMSRIHDNLNAEIAAGTVSTIDEAVEWLRFTYMYASEFAQIKARDTEMMDLDQLSSMGSVMQNRNGTLATTDGKVNCLLQGYISQTFVSNFALSSEMLYIAQNASRIARSYFEIVLRKGWASTTHTCLLMSKCIQSRMWNYQSPLRQLKNYLKDITIKEIKPHTDLLPLDPLPIKALKNAKYEGLYSFEFFNPVQTQVFHCLYHTDQSTLIGAPTSSGKTLCAELAIFRILNKDKEKKCVYIAPLKALVRERVLDWKQKFGRNLGISVVEISGDHTPELSELEKARLLITTPEKWDGITRSWETRNYVKKVDLVVIDEIHLLGVERGAVLEAIVTRIKLIAKKREIKNQPIRIIGLSTALANAVDIAQWLEIKESGLYNFRPSVRPVPIDVHIQGFSGQHYCPRMALMNKPAFKAIKQFSPFKPTLVFVASRRQTRITALSFVTMLASEDDPKKWLHMDMVDLENELHNIKDENLKLTLPFGIGMHHAGLKKDEKNIVERLFVERKIQVLIATATLAWGINCPAHLVIIKGTEYFDGSQHKYVDFPVTDVLQMIGRAGRPQYDDSAVAVVYVQDVKKNFYKRFLYEPFPVESSLLRFLPNHVNAEICSGNISTKQHIVEYISETYFYRRLFANPGFYEVEDESPESMTKFLSATVDSCLREINDSFCINIDEDESEISPTVYGRIASNYYLEHLTLRHFVKEIRAGLKVPELLRILSYCPEYSVIPVRHNEELIQESLNRVLPISFPKNSVFESPHIKVNLLYQAHFCQFGDLVPDYVTDLRSILDSCIRILQAMLDVSLTNSWMDTSIAVVILLQQIIQGRWYWDHPLLCLPYLKEHSIEGIGQFLTIPELQAKYGIEKKDKISRDEMKKIIQDFMDCTILDEFEAKNVVESLLKWPILKIMKMEILKDLNQEVITFKKATAITLNPKIKYKLKVKIQMLGPNKTNTQVYSQRFNKEKTAGWIILIGNKKENSILGFKKVSPIVDSKEVRISFTSPAMPGNYTLTVFILSDSFLGIDQEYNFPCEVRIDRN
ncbi:hypothetical protein FO519_003357 [Halicephalobus sp. NKZ332]|nr:hypothetical protein FO519_003357 [Halicephalobus sp. NKZ332]